jgi:pimeloyl-ACP methyl ester carboxylesterase
VRGHWNALLLTQVPGHWRHLAVRALGLQAGSSAITTPFLPEWVVPLQPSGDLRPVFVFPASHSDPAMHTDAAIARLVGSNRPVWGLAHTAAHRDLVRQAGVAALGAEYVRQIRALQPTGPYLLFGNCMGGYLAWETARQLLSLGHEIAGVAFFESPLRTDFAQVRAGPVPVESANVWRLGHYYGPEPLNVFLTHVMTSKWHGAKWWRPWRHVALLGTDAVLLPEGDGRPHAEHMAAAIRNWAIAAESPLHS